LSPSMPHILLTTELGPYFIIFEVHLNLRESDWFS
jgi:hypothetical protein